ncbi:MAG: hypothetical protein MSA13_06795 [Prevotella sp.]|nr:hypothetical protein [Prevotella sp.]
MKRLLLSIIVTLVMVAVAFAQSVKVTWQYSDIANLSATSVSGDAEGVSLVTGSYALGAQLTAASTLTSSNADTGYTPVTYEPAFTALQPSAQVTSATSGHNVAFGVTPATGHKFRPTKVSFDACKVGTDAGGIVVKIKESGGTETQLESVTPLRNKIASGNNAGYSHHEFYVNNVIVEGKAFLLMLYITDIATTKTMALRNISIEGELDSEIKTVGDYLTSLTCKTAVGGAEATEVSLYDMIKGLKNGESVRYTTKLSADPTDFSATLSSTLGTGYNVYVTYSDHTANVSIKQDGVEKMTFTIIFTVSTKPVKPAATPLKRGLMALHQSTGNLVSWRARATDDPNLSFRLWRGTSAAAQNTKVNSGKTISGKTNYLDSGAAATAYYRLEVLDADGNVIESEVSGKTWDNQTLYIPLKAGAPTDPSGNGATYTPNDASYCDMDGDGEYEIILKWSPSNEKDAASSGATSNVFFDCYKMNGTRLWRIDMGQNFFASAHTIQFIAWDFDGDGYGEFMVKTAPGTIDGQGNYVILGNDDPTANLKSSRGKQDHGSEYITVFDGMTGAELATIPYHTDYNAGLSYWGDSNQNRSERYLAGIAWLDGKDGNPSPIFARGYYSGAFVGAYDWDGETLKERWVSRNTTSGAGLWGEGAHWMSVGDCTGDGKQDIVYGSAALKSDGTLLYRTGLGHGDALHLGDFVPENPGLEVFMSHEKAPYGADLRDAKTGKLLLHPTASGDTGRGLIGHFNPEAEGAYFQTSASAALYDWTGATVNETVTHGGGASLNNRIYWNGTLADDYYDKSVLEAYDPNTKTFGRMQVNGSNYTIGTLNNSTKYNPCVLGDILGDWREEIVTWAEVNGVYNLIINATNYETPYTVPHLMDDLNYRAQVINQNCCYNQPPHLSYNLRDSKKITRKCFEVEPMAGLDNGAATLGKYWDCFYTTYPVIIPKEVTAWKVTARVYTDNVDTVKVTKLNAGTVMAANTAIIYNSNTPEVTFVPSAKTANTMTLSKLNGSYCTTTLAAHSDTEGYYEFRDGERGLGFYLADGKSIARGTGYAAFTGTVSAPLHASYVLGDWLNPSNATGVTECVDDTQTTEGNGQIYNLQGIRLDNIPEKGVYIINKRKYTR